MLLFADAVSPGWLLSNRVSRFPDSATLKASRNHMQTSTGASRSTSADHNLKHIACIIRLLCLTENVGYFVKTSAMIGTD